jgi:hypothetical protein
MSNDANLNDQAGTPATADGLSMRSPISAYSDLDPAQTHAAARVFIERFATIDDDRAREYAQLDPDAVLPSQLHEMHKYASERYPELLADTLQHPDLASPTATGDFAAGERSRLDARASDQQRGDQG